MDEPVDGRHRHAGVREDVIPAGEWLVGGYQKTFPLVCFGDQLEQHAGFGLVLPHIRQIVQDDQVEPVEFGERRRQLQT